MGYLGPRQAQYAGHGTRYTVDVLTADFVWAYVEATEAKHQMMMMYGAPKCPTLGEDLARMYREGKLERSRVGLGPGSVAEGFPPWVYSYSIARFLWPRLEKPTC